LASRIATGPSGHPESIRALIESDPSVIQPGLRLLDFDIRTGPETTLDAIGVDPSGSLAIVAVADGDAEAALVRLLDGHLWAADQRDLLGRLYAERGVDGDRPARGFLLAPAFTHAFLRRLSLLSVQVVPCLARAGGGDGAVTTIVEPAARIFGLETAAAQPGPEDGGDGRQPFWPEGILPSEEPSPRRSVRWMQPAEEQMVSDPTPPPARAEDPLEPMPWPDSPEERFPWEMEEGYPGSVQATGEVALPGRAPVAAEAPGDGVFETLTTEEMEEFERFERQRLERGRRSS